LWAVAAIDPRELFKSHEFAERRGKDTGWGEQIGLVRQRADVIGFGALGGTKFPTEKCIP
jgi:hypothetical protein